MIYQHLLCRFICSVLVSSVCTVARKIDTFNYTALKQK
jgi:hypothetical protein